MQKYDKSTKKTSDSTNTDGWDLLIRDVESEIETLKLQVEKMSRLERQLEILHLIKKEKIPWTDNPGPLDF